MNDIQAKSKQFHLKGTANKSHVLKKNIEKHSRNAILKTLEEYNNRTDLSNVSTSELMKEANKIGLKVAEVANNNQHTRDNTIIVVHSMPRPSSEVIDITDDTTSDDCA